jgi:branched-chain amino acid transport system permease protein
VIGDVFAYLVFFLVIALTYALACLGLNLQWGFTGLFNVGVAGFIAVGAYTSALLTAPPTPERLGGLAWPIAAGWVAAALVAGAVALAVGALTLRLRHDYLAIATFGIAVTIQLLATNLVRLTGGPFGIHGVPRPFAQSVASPLGRNVAYLAVVAGLVAAVYVALERLVRSPWGRVLRGLREDEAAAAALGKSPSAFRLQAFVIGAMVMGLAGAVYAHFVGFVAPEDFLPILTFQIWTMLVLGGSGNNRGAVVGALAVWALWSASGAALAAALPQAWQARGAALQTVLIGLVLAAALLVRPRGLLGEETVVSPHARLE